MKSSWIALVVFFVYSFSYSLGKSSSEAAALFCQQNPRDVRIEVSTGPDKYRLSVTSPMGFEYLPQFDAPASLSQIPWMKYQSEQLQSLGDHFWVEFKASDCKSTFTKKIVGSQLECSGALASSSEKVQFHTFTISSLTDSSFSGEWNSLRIRLGVSAKGEYGSDFFFISIPVPTTACSLF